MLRLTVRIHGSPERLYETTEPRVTIGRGPGNLLVIDNPHVSSQHARIECGSGGATLADVGSTNGSMIQRGSKRLPVEAGGASIKLEVGDTLVLGDTEAPVVLMLLDDGAGGATHPVIETPTTAVAEAPVDSTAGGKTLARRPNAQFAALPAELLEGPGGGHALFELARCLIGGDADALVEAAARAVFALCPRASHVFASLGGSPERVDSRKYCIARGGEQGRWMPSRMAMVRASVTGEAWLVGDVRVDESSEGSRSGQRVATAVVAPLTTGKHSLGVLFVDSRASRAALDVEDLQRVCAIAHLLALGLDRAHAVAVAGAKA